MYPALRFDARTLFCIYSETCTIQLASMALTEYPTYVTEFSNVVWLCRVVRWCESDKVSRVTSSWLNTSTLQGKVPSPCFSQNFLESKKRILHVKIT